MFWVTKHTLLEQTVNWWLIKRVNRTCISRRMQPIRPKGKSAWIISLREFKNDKEKWLAVYHLRSVIESVFSSIKKRWGSFLHSRKKWMQRKELALKVLVYNIKQVLMVRYAGEKGIPLWVPVK